MLRLALPIGDERRHKRQCNIWHTRQRLEAWAAKALPLAQRQIVDAQKRKQNSGVTA
jgi:hypothetical protein